jgi:hypothetical protein
MLGVAAQLPEQPGSPAGGPVTKPFSFQDEDAGASAGKLHSGAQPGNAATDDNYIPSTIFRHGLNLLRAIGLAQVLRRKSPVKMRLVYVLSQFSQQLLCFMIEVPLLRASAGKLLSGVRLESAV